MADRFQVAADKGRSFTHTTKAMGKFLIIAEGDTAIIHHSFFILHYEEIALRILPSAFFSSLDTWA